MCQHSTKFQDYLDIVKLLYKDLVAVAKDQETGQFKVHSFAFKIEAVGDFNLFSGKDEDHPQNFFYVVVDPINWHANFLYHKWVSHW